MAVPLQDLRQLTWLAHQRTGQARHDLLDRITTLFLQDPDSYTEQQSEYFGDIMIELAFAIEQEVREELACRIADEVNAPRGLVLRLANDVISVARPVLERSPVLSECDLIQLVRQRSQEHMLAITIRPDIQRRLSAVLCERGGDEVVQSLLRNKKADIVSETLQYIADRAKGSSILQSALVEHGDLPKAVILGLIDHVSKKLKDELLQRLTDMDRCNFDEVIGTLKAQAEMVTGSRAEQEIEELERRGKLNQFALIQFVNMGKNQQFLLGMARFSGIGVPALVRILSDKTGQALAILARAQDFDAKGFKMIAMSSVTGIPKDLKKVLNLVGVYQRLGKQDARDAIEHWQSREAELADGEQSSLPAMAAA